MNALLDFGIQITLWMQNLGSWLVKPMGMISFLGTEQFFLILAPVIYWCIDPNLGMRLAFALTFSSYTNDAFKLLLRGPRPFWYDPNVIAYSVETGFGIPSGHAQNTLVVWGVLARSLRRNWAWIGVIIISILMGLSRIYLGMHFITDVLAGWLLGALLLWLISKLERPVLDLLKQLSFGRQIILVASISIMMILSGFVIGWSRGAQDLPQVWLENANHALPDNPITPFSLSPFFTMSGTFFGLSIGALWIYRKGGFSSRGTWKQYAARYILGLVGVLILWMGLGEIFPRGEYLLAYALRFLRYGLAGAWVTGLAPWAFRQLKWAEQRKEIVSPNTKTV